MAEEVVDVLIIGSGHSGGMAAKILTEKGISCLMLNAGPVADIRKDTEVKPAFSLPYRGFKQPGQLEHVYQSNEFNANTWVDEKEVPYTYDAKNNYNWVRVRLFGGRSLFWSRVSFRLSDYEFKGKSHDGFGDDWPISLADLDPYYSRVEKIFRVRGAKHGIAQFPDGSYIVDDEPYPKSIQRLAEAAKTQGVQIAKQRIATGINGLASSVNLLLPDAFKTGKLRAIPNVVVRELSVDKNTGKISQVHFVDRISRREMSVKARVVVLAAGCLESTRLLLNSGEGKNGIANSSGVLGHYLADQIYGPGVVCSVPEARDGKSTKEMMDGSGIFPRFRNIDTKANGFVRGGALNVWSSTGGLDPRSFTEYGEPLQKKLDSYHGSKLEMGLMGEVLSRYENHVRINHDVVDAWGIPVLHIDARYGENETNLTKDAVDSGAAFAEAAGFEVLAKNYQWNPPGYSIHELGTARMGDDPKTSVLNKWNQSHDIKNLFVVDASAFVSAGWQNPTLTLTSLSMRASEYLAEEMKQGNV